MRLTKANGNLAVSKIKLRHFLTYTIGLSILTGSALAEQDAVPVSAEAVPATSAISAAALQSDEDIYPTSFFEQYTPRNAMDMIRRLPGFSFDEGSDVRGFGGAAGNVIIDGARPTSKSGGLRSVLERIPAAQVERIIIVRGGVSAGEAAGQSIVANVIRKATGTSGTWNAQLRRSDDGRIRPVLEATLTSKIGKWDTSFSLDIGANPRYREALIIERDADGQIVDAATEIFPAIPRWLNFSGEASHPVAGGKLTINGRFEGENWNGETSRLGYLGHLPDSGANDTFWLLDEQRRWRQGELGLTWAKTFSHHWKLNLIGLATISQNKYASDLKDENLIEGTSTRDLYADKQDTSEFIARATYGKTTGKFKPEFGFELVSNKLDNQSENFEDGTAVDLDSGNIMVTELRGETFATMNYQATSKLSLESGLTFEASRVKVSGDADQSRTLKFLKPRISATYSFDDDLQLTLEAERTVGQLDLSDFAASTDAEDDRVTAGNPDLRPETKYVVGATLNWKFSQRGSLKVEALHEWRSDILEQIILPSGGEGTGNAGSARFWAVNTELNLPLDGILKGGLLEVEHFYRRSRFEDPVLGGAIRTVSWYTPNWIRINFRQDLVEHKVAWGLTYWGSFEDAGYQVAERLTFGGDKRLRGFIETTRFWGVKAKFEVTHPFVGNFTRSRFFFDGNRGGAFTGSEISHRERPLELRFEVSGTF